MKNWLSIFISLYHAMRPKQWTKNGLLFAALVFSHHLFDLDYFLKTVYGIIVFSLLSSSGYIFNDWLDIEADRLHPKKKNRPMAAGVLPVKIALTFMVIIFIVGLYTSFLLSYNFGICAIIYLLLTYSYTFYLKHQVILDVMALSSGFIVRAVAGASVIGVPVSPWFLICTAFLSLFLAMNKRLAEISLLDYGAGKHRKILEEYSPQLLDRMLNVVTTGTVMSYALYTFDTQSTLATHQNTVQNSVGDASKFPFLMLTIPFVVYGIFRYQYLVTKHSDGGAPELTLLRDRPLQINIALYLCCVIIIQSLK